MVNRRDFLRSTAVGAAAIAVGARQAEKLLASPYGKPVGIELYTVRENLWKDTPATIRKVAEIGYKEVELDHDRETSSRRPPRVCGMTGKEFRKLLEDNGLRCPSGHYMLADYKEDWDVTIEQAHDIGLDYMVNAWIPEDYRFSMDDWKWIVDTLNKAAEPVQKAGMTFNYHNHDFEFMKFGDTVVYDYLTKNLDPKIHFTLDCYWATHAGQDPVALIKARPGRVPILHIKDMPKGLPTSVAYDARLGNFVPIGQGAIDWKRIFKAAPIGGMKHFYYEQDYCEKPPLECAKISFDYLNSLTV